MTAVKKIAETEGIFKGRVGGGVYRGRITSKETLNQLHQKI